MRAGRADPAGRGVTQTTLRCVPRTGLWVLVREVCPTKAEEIDAAWLLPIFKFSAPCGTRRRPRPNPCWGWHSAVGWNLRSLPILLLLYAGAAPWITWVSFKQHVPTTNLRAKKGVRPAEVSLVFWILSSCDGSHRWAQLKEIHFD